MLKELEEFIAQVKKIGQENSINFSFDINKINNDKIWEKQYLLECYHGVGAYDNVPQIEVNLEEIEMIIRSLIKELYPK